MGQISLKRQFAGAIESFLHDSCREEGAFNKILKWMKKKYFSRLRQERDSQDL
jgi:hypothetical protein